MSMAQFDRQAREAAVRVVHEATEAIRTAAIALYSDLQTDVKTVNGYGSPIASGRYVASMRISVNQIDYSFEPPDPNYVYDRSLPPRTIRNRPIAAASARMRTFRIGDRIYISNAVPYARRIEIGRHSWQAPEGVFEPTVRRWIRQFQNVNLRVRYV